MQDPLGTGPLTQGQAPVRRVCTATPSLARARPSGPITGISREGARAVRVGAGSVGRVHLRDPRPRITCFPPPRSAGDRSDLAAGRRGLVADVGTTGPDQARAGWDGGDWRSWGGWGGMR